jgi:riboflavin kinase/FMN adenylyltransferase
MEVVYGLPKESLEYKYSIITIGIFDGVHLGHQKIIKEVVAEANRTEGISILITFDPHPEEVISSKSPPFLLPLEERIRLISDMGVALMIVSDFTQEIADIPAEEFVQKILLNKLKMCKIYVGYDYAFGKDRTGNIELLKNMSITDGFKVEVISPVKIDNEIVSSTRIRYFLAQGNITKANAFLGRRYTVKAKVIHGDKRGRILGYPTANCICEENILLPLVGVYVVQVNIDNIWYGGIANIGYAPTFRGEELKFEIHILDFDKKIYGKEIEVAFIDRIRDEKVFDTSEELLEQIKKDEISARNILFGLF